MKRISAFLFAGFLLVFMPQIVEAQSSESGNAKVIFYRASNDSGKPCGLTSKNQELVKLKKGEKFEQTLAPGTYYYMADPSTKQVFKLEVSAGQIYYVRAVRDGNTFTGQAILENSTAQEFQRDLAAND